MNTPLTIQVTPKPVTVEITKVQLVMAGFTLNATEGTVCATMLTEDNKYVDRKLVKIPPEVYSQWAQDDTLVVDYVLQELELAHSQGGNS